MKTNLHSVSLLIAGIVLGAASVGALQSLKEKSSSLSKLANQTNTGTQCETLPETTSPPPVIEEAIPATPMECLEMLKQVTQPIDSGDNALTQALPPAFPDPAAHATNVPEIPTPEDDVLLHKLDVAFADRDFVATTNIREIISRPEYRQLSRTGKKVFLTELSRKMNSGELDLEQMYGRKLDVASARKILSKGEEQ